MKSAERIDTEPLEFSFDRLKKKATELKTEMHLAFEAGDYESAKRYAAQLRVVESQIDQVTSAIERKRQKTEQAAAEAEKAAERERKAQESFMEGAVAGSSAQTKGVLMNEQAARKARDAGRDRDADAFQKTAEQMKASMTQAQREEYEGLTKPVRLGRQAGPGESQSIIDDIARNNINFERQKRGEQPLPQGDARPPPKPLDVPGRRPPSRGGLVLAGLGAAFGLGWLIGGTFTAALTGLLWGGAVRLLVLHHVTFSINSLCHFFGRRRFDTGDESRNLAWLSLLSFGEAWHNNHHAFPTSAAHGMRWYEVDTSSLLIRGLERVGLVWDVVRIDQARQQKKLLAETVT
jgi:hypothetical protein